MPLRAKIVLVGLVFAAVPGVCLIGRDLGQTIHESYAVWWVADMVIEHLKANEDAWPTSWEDLEDDYETCVRRSGRPRSFVQLKSRTVVDWDVNVDDLRESAINSDEAGFRVIRPARSGDHHWEHAEPDTIVWEYLRMPPSTAE